MGRNKNKTKAKTKTKDKKKNQSTETSSNTVPNNPTARYPRASAQAIASLAAPPSTLIEVSLTPQTSSRPPEPPKPSGDALLKLLELLDENEFVISSTGEEEKPGLNTRSRLGNSSRLLVEHVVAPHGATLF
jgi:hypothetical protein